MGRDKAKAKAYMREWRNKNAVHVREYMRAYLKTESGKNSTAKSEEKRSGSEKRRASHARANSKYSKTGRGKEIKIKCRKKHEVGIKFKATIARYQATEKGIASIFRYRSSAKGRATIATVCARRRAANITQTPKWADLKKISEIYKTSERISRETGTPHHVDHIYPLRGKFVSGLHVESNLQILTATENVRKGNRVHASTA